MKNTSAIVAGVILTCVLFFDASGASESHPLDSPGRATGTPPAHIDARRMRAEAAAASDRRSVKIADSAVSDVTHAGRSPTLDQVKAATAVADRLTTAASIAIVLTRPEIKSVSDLAGKSLAIDNELSASSGNILNAIANAGAADVRLTASLTKALDRVLGGEVPAAVLILASQEAAESFPDIAGFNILRVSLAPKSSKVKNTDSQPVANTVAATNVAGAKTADPRPTGALDRNSPPRTTQELVTAATGLAEQMTAGMTDRQGTATIPPSEVDLRTALVLARPEIKSLSDLAGKEVAIDSRLTAIGRSIRTAVAAAGATEVQVSDSQTKALDRVIGGETPAAILTLVSQEAAEAFPDISGFKVFRVPMTPKASPAKVENPQPAAGVTTTSNAPPAKIADLPPKDGAATDFSSQAIRELVAATTTVAEQMTAATQAAPTNETGPQVAILMARPEIKSISDLAGKHVAIDEKQSASIANVRTAIAKAGAADADVREAQMKAIDRLIAAEVPAAVLTLASPEAAEAFPEIRGFRVFRIPLLPASALAQTVVAAPDKNATARAPDQTAQAAPPAKPDQAGELKQAAKNDSFAQIAPATKLADAKAVLPQAQTRVNSEATPEIAKLMARASALLGQGNIGAARLVLERAAEAGSAQANFTLGETYDPLVLRKWGTYGTVGDATKAREFYAKAEAGGIKEAKARVDALHQ